VVAVDEGDEKQRRADAGDEADRVDRRRAARSPENSNEGEWKDKHADGHRAQVAKRA